MSRLNDWEIDEIVSNMAYFYQNKGVYPQNDLQWFKRMAEKSPHLNVLKVIVDELQRG